MCTVLLPPGVNPIAVNIYIYIYITYVKHLNCKLYYQQLRLKYWYNLARYWLQASWGWHDSVETCRSVIICEIIVHLLVIVHNIILKNQPLCTDPWEPQSASHYWYFVAPAWEQSTDSTELLFEPAAFNHSSHEQPAACYNAADIAHMNTAVVSDLVSETVRSDHL